MIVGPDNRTAYVSNFEEGTGHTLAVIDLVHARALKSIDVSPMVGPHGMALREGKLWFTADRSKALGVLDLNTRKLVGVLGTGQDRTHMVWISPDGAKILASNAGSGTLSIYDAIKIAPTTTWSSPPPLHLHQQQDEVHAGRPRGRCPVIGTACSTSPKNSQSVIAAIRGSVEGLASSRILYGGSMKGDNAPGLMAQPDIDGGLIGGASLTAKAFGAVIDYGIPKAVAA